MSKIYYLIITFALHSLVLAQGYQPEQLTPQHLTNVPLMLHKDALQFYEAFNPLIVREPSRYTNPVFKNPYELYFEATLFKMFDLVTDYDSIIYAKTALDSIVNVHDAIGPRAYLLRMARLSNPVFSLNTNIAQQYLHNFQAKFATVIKDLIAKKNLFAYYIKGVIDYEESDLNNNHSGCNIAEKYITAAADGLIEPALLFLEWKYENFVNDHKLNIAGEKVNNVRNLNLITNLVDKLKFIISDDFSTELLTFQSFGNGTHDDTFYVDHLSKLTSSVYATPDFNGGYCDNFLKHLTKTIGSARRSSSYTTSSIFWKILTVSKNFFVTAVCADQLYYGLTYSPSFNLESSNQESQSILNVMVKNSLLAGCSSLIPLIYDCILIYNSPSFQTINAVDLDREVVLTALYFASTNNEENRLDIAEITADKVIDLWSNVPAGLGLFKNKTTLSQMATQNR